MHVKQAYFHVFAVTMLTGERQPSRAHKCHCTQPVAHLCMVCHAPICVWYLQAELDRFCNAMIAIREEIKQIEDGKAEK